MSNINNWRASSAVFTLRTPPVLVFVENSGRHNALSSYRPIIAVLSPIRPKANLCTIGHADTFRSELQIMKTTINAMLFMWAVSGNAIADDAGILRCRGNTDAKARLACYDALLVGTGNSAPVAAKPRPPAELLPSPSASPSSLAAPFPQAQKADQFGLENRSNPATLDAIESHIAGSFEGWDAKTNIKLANGQVWQIADDSSRSLSMIDPKVRIRRGALGSFYLEFEKSNHSPRVRRVQ